MQINFRNSAIVAVLGAAALATWYASRPAPPPRVTDPVDPGQLGYYLRNAVLLGTDATGRTYYRIHAAEAAQNPSDDALMLTDVRVEFRDEASVAWSIAAAHAAAGGSGGPIDLETVRLESRQPGDVPSIVIESDRLRLEPASYLASSDAPVVVTFGRTAISAVGLEADLRTDRLELRSRVHGRFTP